MPTDGLVGFLSSGGNNTHWNDEYLGVGATVSGEATKVVNGFALAGRGASIVWPVGGGRRNPGHGSAGEEVTLVATVTINEAPQDATPLLGVRTAEAGMYLGLWYDEHKHWRTEFGAEADAQTMTWEEGKAYRVVITVENGTGSAYVDGQLVGSLKEKPPSTDLLPPPPPPPLPPHEQFQRDRPPERVSHIFVGEYRNLENAEFHVTVTNVLLYNRCFNASEVAALERKEEEASVTEPEVPRAAASSVSGPTSSAHDETAATGGVSEEPSGAAGTGPATTDAAGSSAGDASVPRGAGTAGPAGDAPLRSGPMDDGQALQTPPSHAPETVGGLPSASAAPPGETPNAAAKENGAGPQTAAEEDGGHEAPSNAATAPTAPAPGQPGSPPTRDAAPHLSNNSTTFSNATGPFPMNTESDGAVRGCVAWLLLLTLLALCGVAAGF
ncbi:trans-sialidase [Trypanosoma conorhini]|uniref:Trans-sialidase n=1 Tax=Trypanosoma conorhini TaxID=83891 RepID=A0A422MPV2_9TRYP|nr:trans-sialidase [Trypanosoma conorhini]RNE95234.1 trans-sialidase [Trypanosoma conorhini]